MKDKLISFFGLKGSWSWACRQMRKGYKVRRAYDPGAVKYRLDLEGQGRIEWNFDRLISPNNSWNPAYIFLQDFECTDWIIV